MKFLCRISLHLAVCSAALPAVSRIAVAQTYPADQFTWSSALPRWSDIPTVGEFLPIYEASGGHSTGAPRNPPAEIVEKLNKEINVALIDPRMQARIADLAAVPM